MGVPENRIGGVQSGKGKSGMRPLRSGCADAYPSCGPATPRPVESCAPHSIGVYARSVDRTCLLSLAHCQSVRHRNNIPNFILDSCEPLSYHFETLVQWKLDSRTRRTGSYANDAMHGYRNLSPSF